MKRKYQVGGIVYQILQHKPSEKDNNDNIDLSTITSMAHSPFVLEDTIDLTGYTPQFNITQPEPDVESNDRDISSVPITPITASFTTSSSIAGSSPTSTPVSTSVSTPVVPVVSDDTSNASSTASNTTAILRGKADFKKLEKIYEEALKKRGIDVRYAKWLAAQDALESGWGKSQGARVHNYGNLTTGSSWKGEHFVGDDHDGKGNPIKQKFRSYSSVEEYVEDKLNFLHYKRYAGAFSGDPDGFIERIWKAGYATSPKYVNNVRAVYNTWDK